MEPSAQLTGLKFVNKLITSRRKDLLGQCIGCLYAHNLTTDDKLMIYFSDFFFQKKKKKKKKKAKKKKKKKKKKNNTIWHFMQIVSNGDNLHGISNPVFWGKNK